MTFHRLTLANKAGTESVRFQADADQLADLFKNVVKAADGSDTEYALGHEGVVAYWTETDNPDGSFNEAVELVVRWFGL